MDLEKLKQGILIAQRYHEQVVLVLGQSASELFYDATATEGLPSINIGLDLSAKLLEVPNNHHPKVAALFFAELIEQAHAQTLLLDHIEVLFDRSLALDPLKLLKACAKNITLVVAWPGVKSNSSLVYAVPSHPEYRSYKESELNEIIFLM